MRPRKPVEHDLAKDGPGHHAGAVSRLAARKRGLAARPSASPPFPGGSAAFALPRSGAGAERFVSGVVGVAGGGFEVVACLASLCPAFFGQTRPAFGTELFAPADRQGGEFPIARHGG